MFNARSSESVRYEYAQDISSGYNSHNTCPFHRFYPHQMFNASSFEHIHYEDPQDISSGYRGNRPVAIDLNAPNSELLRQMINLNETYSDGSGGLERDGEFGLNHESTHFQLFGRRVLTAPVGLSWDQHQQRDVMYPGAENYNRQINTAQGTFPLNRSFFGSSSSYPNNNLINNELLRFGNRVNGGISVQESSSMASHAVGISRDIHVRRTENRVDNVATSLNFSGVSAAEYPVSSFWQSSLTIDYLEAAIRDLQCPAGSYRDIHVRRTENRVDNVPTRLNPSGVSAAHYPVSSFWPSWLTIDYLEAAVRDLQCPALPIHNMEGYGVGFPNVNNESFGLRGNNQEIQFNDDMVHPSDGMAVREMLETRVGAARSAENFVVGIHTNGENFEVYIPPFFPETQETFAVRENLIAEEDYIEEEDDVYADIDMYPGATEHPLQEEEARDEVVHVIVDNSTFEEEHFEEEVYAMDEDMEVDVDDMSYEELLALEQQIGNVSTGLSEVDIFWRMKWYRHITFSTSSPEEEDLCGICLDEYIGGQDIGELDCEHYFHYDCIKKWLMQKNTCPMCKRTGLAY
ncbi:E3 ubiquitin-protein like [Abeliophyllum distichum]|uniref:RING-type E3 ubiquitin transferase n=1 Tax=Abeliophyllum distichum TaxID=126358 RepID=A0ABD1SJ10_9LAMI